MDGFRVVFNFPLPITVAGVHTFVFAAPCGLTFIRADAIASTAAVGTFSVGPVATPTGWINAGVPGASNAASAFVAKDFNGSLCDQISPPHIAKDALMMLTVSNSSQIDLNVALTFLEG